MVSEGLRRMECLPIVQDDFPPDYKSVREMLVTKIKTCNAVVHLAGFYYGAESQPLPADDERRSFTQMEYEIAMELGLPCYVFLCGEKFPFDEHDPEPEEKRALQLAHRGRLLSRDELFYEFDTREDLNSRTRELQLSVDALRDELAKERSRRRMTLVVSVAALLLALVGGVVLFKKTQDQGAMIEQTTSKLDKQGELIAMLLAEQARLRERGGSGDDLAAEAEKNVARQANLSAGELRAAVTAEIADAGALVARSSGMQKTDALKRLADAQLAAGLKTEAITSYGKRLELLDRSKQQAEWARAVAVLADLMFSRDYADDGPRMVREALAWAETEDALGPEHSATLRLKESQRQFLFIKGDSEAAIKLGKEILAVRDRDAGEDSPESLNAAAYLGRHLRSNGEFGEADSIFKRVINTCERLCGEDDIRTLDARWDLGGSLEKQERYSEAEAIYKDIIGRAKAGLGAGDSATLALSASLAFLNETQGKDAEAMAIWENLLEDAEEFNEPDDAVVQTYTHIVAVRLLEQEKYERAEKLYRKVYEARLRRIGPNQEKTIDILEGLKILYQKTDDDEGYTETLTKIVAAKIVVLGSDAPEIAHDQYLLGIHLAGDGQYAEGLKPLEECLALRKRVLGSGDSKTLEVFVMVQIVANRMEDWELAEKKGEEALAAYEGSENGEIEFHAAVLYRLAVSKEELGKKEAALSYARRAAKMAEGEVKADHWLHELPAEIIARLE